MNGIEVTVNINLNGEKVAGITTGEQAAETLPPGDAGREVTQEEEQRFAVASDLAFQSALPRGERHQFSPKSSLLS